MRMYANNWVSSPLFLLDMCVLRRKMYFYQFFNHEPFLCVYSLCPLSLLILTKRKKGEFEKRVDWGRFVGL